MLNESRLSRVRDKMKKHGWKQLLVTDPLAIFWLCGQWISPGERFLGLLIKDSGMPVLYLNRLFSFAEDPSIRLIWFTDTDNIVPLLTHEIDSSEILAVDKEIAGRFLLLMMDSRAASGYANGSVCVDECRAVKDEAEIEKMRRSSRINDEAMGRFRALVHEGVTEIEIADQALKIYKELGATAFSFDPIVSFGANAADPHHSPDETVLKEGDCVLFDIGCVVDDYCSDMTRTFYYKTEPDERVRNIYELVRQANQKAEDMLKPGIVIANVDACARDLISAGGYGTQFNHRLGHFIGLRDHEYGDVSSTNHNLTQPGNIFSIEPGIYCMGDTGVRIEDLVLITENGHEVLNHYPKQLTVID